MTDSTVTPREAAERLGVTYDTVTRWVRDGFLRVGRSPSAHGRGRIRIPVSEVERLQAELTGGRPEEHPS
jgi:excisionase family DNA binding protein